MSIELTMPFSRAVDAAKDNFDATYICAVASYVFVVLTEPDTLLFQKLNTNISENKNLLRKMHYAGNLLLSRGSQIFTLSTLYAQSYVERTADLSEQLVSYLQNLPIDERIKNQDSYENFLQLLETLLRETEDAIEQYEREEEGDAYDIEHQDDDITYQQTNYGDIADPTQYFSPLGALYFAAAFAHFIIDTFPFDTTEQTNLAFSALFEALNAYENFEDDISTAENQEEVLDLLFEIGDGLNLLSDHLKEMDFNYPALLIAADAMAEICHIYTTQETSIVEYEDNIDPETPLITYDKSNTDNVIYPTAFHPNTPKNG